MAQLAGYPNADYDYLLKIIMVGDSGVGKSALLKSFMGEEFTKHYVSTIGVDFEIKQVIMNDKKVHLQIWDTAGQERFRTITTSYYRSSDAILLVFDVTDANSFKNIQAWLEDVRQYARKDVDIMLVGNKVDLEKERKVEFKSAKEFADDNFIPYMETSAKTSFNVNQAFNTVALAALQEKMAEKDRVEENTGNKGGYTKLKPKTAKLDGSNQPASSSSSCC
jgi:Ras-related protein Rab-1A